MANPNMPERKVAKTKVAKTKDEIESLIRNKVQESLHLEYKSSQALIDNNNKPKEASKKEIAKDVSAFANSDGGMIVYGVKEYGNKDKDKKHLPEKIDEGIDNKLNMREWLDNVISSNITPPISYEIIQIDNGNGKSLYVIDIPKSYNTPHQASDNKYYKRYNFKSSPMDHYEINDLRSRRADYPKLNVKTIMKGARYKREFTVVIENIGDAFAKDIQFELPNNWPNNWPNKTMYDALKEGIKGLPPKESLKYKFEYMAKSKSPVHGPESLGFPKIKVSYSDPRIEGRIEDEFDLNDFILYDRFG